MTVTLTLNAEVEKGLMARAQERGFSINDYLQEIVMREARLPTVAPSSAHDPFTKANNLSDLLLHSPFAGADLNLERSQDFPRSIELE